MAKMECTGVKCDNDNCDYVDNAAKFEDYDKYLNKPCPKCGENLLTEEDLNTVKALMSMVNNPLFQALEKGLAELAGDDPEETTKLKLNMNGTGNIEIEELDDDETE